MVDVWKLADEFGLTVTERPGTPHSGYRPDDGSVQLSPGMRGRVLRSVLAHEIGHHALGHRPTSDGLLRKRQETAANRWAALTLISPEAYAESERLRDGHLPSIAFDLDVSDELVQAYRQTLTRTDTAVYVHGRFGAGQWAHRADAS
ncbi:MAG: ImmA/IrrE family metallo-endopeptidase [Microbacterium sp.]